MEMRTILPPLVLTTILLGIGVSCVGGQEVVLVHGAGHGAWCWYEVTTLLQEAGFKTTALDLTSAGPQDITSADTVSTIAQHSQPLLDYLANNVSGQVLLVGHSFGGLSISLAVEQFPAKISHAVFLSAVMPANDQSALTSLPHDFLLTGAAKKAIVTNFANGPTAPPTSLSFSLASAPSFFYNLSPDEAIALALSLLGDQPYTPLTEILTLTPARYGSVPRYYLQTDQDNVWGPGIQEYIIRNNPPDATFVIDGSDHSPFFSNPIATAETLVTISKLSNSKISDM